MHAKGRVPGLAAPLIALWFVQAQAQIEPDWNDVQEPPYEVYPAGPQPIITGSMVNEPTSFVADPFLYESGDTLYIFYEAFIYAEYKGRIAYHWSVDGVNWTFGKICMREAFHQSFPCVFAVDGVQYMLQSGPNASDVRLYRATKFPDTWTLDTVLMSGGQYVDPVVFKSQGNWFMFCSRSGSAVCDLYWSHDLWAGWHAHHLSPIVQNNRGRARPAGRTFRYDSGKLTRYAQKCDVTYGEAVRAFQIDYVSPGLYEEHEVPESPLVEASHSGWNSEGMHTFNPWWFGDRWLVATDGMAQGGMWSIGLYQTLPAAGVDGIVPRPRLLAVPNPFDMGTRIDCAAPPFGPLHAVVIDAAGRVVRRLEGPGSLLWDGRDTRGREVARGVYLVRVTGEEGALGAVRVARAR